MKLNPKVAPAPSPITTAVVANPATTTIEVVVTEGDTGVKIGVRKEVGVTQHTGGLLLDNTLSSQGSILIEALYLM